MLRFVARGEFRPLVSLGQAVLMAIGLLWGAKAYRPEYFASTEPFLLLFFAMYVAIPLLFARRRAIELRDYVDGTLVSFEIVSDDRVDVRLSVTRDDPSEPAVCIVRSRSRDGSETGRREVLIPASPNGTEDIRTEVITSAPPGLADLYGCSLTVPEYLTRG